MNKGKFDIQQFKRENIHSVPEDYFEKLPLKISMRISKSKSDGIFFINRMQWTMSLTAVIVLILTGYFVFNSNNNLPTDIEVDYLAEVSTADVIAYLEDEDISINEIATFVEIDDLLNEIYEDHLEYLDEDISIDQIESLYDDMDYSIESI